MNKQRLSFPKFNPIYLPKCHGPLWMGEEIMRFAAIQSSGGLGPGAMTPPLPIRISIKTKKNMKEATSSSLTHLVSSKYDSEVDGISGRNLGESNLGNSSIKRSFTIH